jgi:hypothetical protein
MIIYVQMDAQPDLMQVVDALGHKRAPLGLPKRGQEHPRQDAYDRDDHEQLNQGKAGSSSIFERWAPGCWAGFHLFPSSCDSFVTLFTVVNVL